MSGKPQTVALIGEAEIVELVRMAGADPSNAKACNWLRTALDMIPGIISAKAGKRPQKERNKRLEAVAGGAKSLRIAFDNLDWATRAALYQASQRDGYDDSPWRDVLARLLSGRDSQFAGRFFDALERTADAAKGVSLPGRPVNEGNDEVVGLLAAFVERFGARTPSARSKGPFHRFVRAAYRHATGEESDLLDSVRRVLRTRSGVRN